MNVLQRKVPILVAALTLAFLVSGARAFPRHAHTECERNTSWSIWNVQDDRQTSDTVNGKTSETQQTSSRTESHSSRGEDLSLNTTHTTNADGSYHEHQEAHYADNTGQGCGNDGVPQKGDNWSDTDVDSDGNRKEHWEDIIEKNGKCEKIVTDKEWDRTGKLIKDTETRTEVPCSKWYLEILYKGSISVTHSTITYGPNTAKVYLGRSNDGTYTGSYESVFDAEMTGECTGSGTFPVTYDITAKEVKFGDQDELDFTVDETKGRAATVSCWGGSGGVSLPIQTNNYTFSLAAEDGASWTHSIPPGYVTLTFTLRKR
jgi:hypothetical protein